MRWTVRRGVPSDAELLAGIHVRAWRHAYPGIVPQPVLDRMVPENRLPGWRGRFDQPAPEGVFVAVDEDGRPGAYCVVGLARQDGDRHPDLATGELMAIYADPAVRGTGAGHAVHDAGVAHLTRSGIRYGVLWVFAANRPSRRFYEAHGWRHDGTVSHMELGGERIAEVRYGRFLTDR
jgi:RimJ/RimL family protein N-acetyltransferase